MLGDSVKRRTRSAAPRKRAASRPAAKERRGWRRLAITLLAALAPFVIGYLIAVFVLFPAPELADAGLAVPSLTGLTTAEAQRELDALGLGTLDVTRLPHPDVPEGTVTAQSPLAGQHLLAGGNVHVSVSTGPPRVTVPDVVGFPVDRAAALFSRLGFTVVREEEHSSDEVGRVIRTSPVAGTTTTIPARVTLYVSAGEPPGADPDTGRIGTISAGARWPAREQSRILKQVQPLTRTSPDRAAG